MTGLASAAWVRAVIARLDPALPITDLQSVTEIVALETAARETQIAVLALFATTAVLLAATGIHGLLAFGASQRTQEIGVRMALGATPGAVLRPVLRESVYRSIRPRRSAANGPAVQSSSC